MNIVLRILVILTVLLNGVALWFANSLYAKRNLIIDRNEAFENFAVDISKTFEKADAPKENTAANHEARDISQVSLATADITPDKSDFWEGYNEQLEKVDGAHYSAEGRRADMKEVYILDGEGKPELDNRGFPRTEGAPMDEALKEIKDKAAAQLNRLNVTRGELKKVRTELEDTITDLNAVKKDARNSLKTIAERDSTISTLEGEKATLQSEKATLEEEKTALEEEKATLQADVDKAHEDIESLKEEVAKYKEVIEKMAQSGGKPGAEQSSAVANVPPGVKGTIKRVNNEYDYCIIDVSDEVIKQLIGEDEDRPLPEMEFFIRRPGAANTAVVGKVRLRTLSKDPKALIGDIISGWKQGDIKVGDEVFYLD